MHLEIWRSWTRLIFLEPSAWEYVLLALELVLSLTILVVRRRDFVKLGRGRFLLLGGCLVVPLLSERFLVLGFPGRNLLPPPGVPFAPSQPSAPLFGMLPVVVAAAWLGPGPALLVGLVKGILRAGVATGGICAPFHLALFGFLVGFLLRQDYRGPLPLLARQPIVAVPLMTPFAALLLLMSAFAHVAASGLSGLDYAVTLTSSYFIPMLLESLIAAVAVQVLYLLRPQWRPVRVARRPPPYSRSLNRRLLFLFVPVIGLITVVLVYAVTATALRLATSEAVNQMARDANGAAEGIPYFIQTGQGLLVEFADDERLWRTDEDALETRLRKDMRMVVFFDQLLLLDSGGQPLATHPPQPAGASQLTQEEQVLLERGVESGAPQISSVHRSKQGAVIMSFLAPMSDPSQGEQDGTVSRVLLGRTRLDFNLIIGRILDGLQWTNARGAGFVVDSGGRIVAHPDADALMTTWEIEEGQSPIHSDLRGWAYESRDPQDNTRQLVYYLPVEGYPWGVVVRVPYDMILEQARRIATPLLGLQVLLGGGLVVIISLVTNWVTQPLQKLAAAADRIAEGDLSHPVEIEGLDERAGQDEVARVGVAFEDMRLRLRDRMEDLSLLLEVSQSVSATLELPEGVPFILEGVLRATEAQVARIVLLSADGDPQVVMSRGELREGLQGLDQALARAARDVDRPLVMENLKRAKTLLDSDAVESVWDTAVVKAVVALPIRTKERMAAVMWVGYSAVRQFSDSDIDLLSTLASQTSVLVENARLFQTAESERRRLAAILASTTDAVVVTDRENRILLMNPAAERVFDIRSENVSGRAIDQTPLPRALVDVFDEPLDLDDALTRELALADGRTLYANVSAILNTDGQRLGRVSVMRDITNLKQLDELKSDFVATVSHDLRAPLTFMRGYTTMLPTVGELNQSQREYVEKVLRGIAQMSNLVDDLLDLGRIEANVGLERQPCHLGAILAEAVDSRRIRAAAKDIALRMEPAAPDASDEGAEGSRPGVAIVSGDAALLRQAITNLVDNAIKYTPSGGEVVVSLSTGRASKTGAEGEGRRALVRVSDTGVGIAPEDQVWLFEKFYRVKRRHVPDVPGTGLGLSIVKSIVERHEGTVWVDSELNQGSTFTISLPLLES
jgi:PAS domain S-box-containing protein